MSGLFKLIGAVLAALIAFLHERNAVEKASAAKQQREVDAYNDKIAKARRDAAAEFDAHGVSDHDPNLRD